MQQGMVRLPVNSLKHSLYMDQLYPLQCYVNFHLAPMNMDPLDPQYMDLFYQKELQLLYTRIL